MYQGKFANRSSNKRTTEGSAEPVTDKFQAEQVLPQKRSASHNAVKPMTVPSAVPPRSPEKYEKSRQTVIKNNKTPHPVSDAPMGKENRKNAQRPSVPQQPVFDQLGKRAGTEDSVNQMQFHFDPSFDDFGGNQPGGDNVYQEYWQEQPQKPQKIRRKHHWISGLIFYLLIAAAAGFFYFRTVNKMDDIEGKLVEYEKIQPTFISQNVFAELFETPDWADLYDQAGAEISQYEGRDAYAAYMQEKVGENQLNFRKIADISETELKYGVFLKKEKLATFTMVNHGTSVEQPDWKLGSLELFFKPEQNYYIQNMDNHVVKINGTVLDGSFLIKKDGYTPTEHIGDLGEEVHIPSVVLSEVTDFLVKPTVTMEDAEGNQLEVSYDEASKTFLGPVTQGEIPSEAQELGLNAVKTYCEYMIKKANSATLAKCFKQGTDTFKAITASDLTWIQREKGHSFADEEVSDYIRYNDDTFSIRVSLTWQLTRKDDTIKESTVDNNLVFQRDEKGKWMCIRMTGLDFVEPVTTVRVRFFQDKQVISSRMVESDRTTINCPVVSAPQGKVLAGWFVLQKNEEGKLYYQQVLAPDALGKADVFDGLFEEPTDLYAVFTEEGPVLKRDNEETVSTEAPAVQ